MRVIRQGNAPQEKNLNKQDLAQNLSVAMINLMDGCESSFRYDGIGFKNNEMIPGQGVRRIAELLKKRFQHDANGPVLPLWVLKEKLPFDVPDGCGIEGATVFGEEHKGILQISLKLREERRARFAPRITAVMETIKNQSEGDAAEKVRKNKGSLVKSA